MYNFKHYVNYFLSKMKATKNLSENTLKAYACDLKDFSDFIVQCDDTKSLVTNYVASLLERRKLKDSSIKRKVITLKIFYACMVGDGFLKDNPFQNLKFKFKQEQRLPKILTISEVRKLLGSIQKAGYCAATDFARFETVRDLALLDLIISTGIRIGEARTLKVEDIILQQQTILVHGKGRKQRLLYISCQQTWQNLKNWLAVRKNKNLLSPFVFINKRLEQMSLKAIESVFNKYKRVANINPSATPHYLRHTFATNLLSSGADIRSVQELLGHASITTTQIYTEVTMARKRQVLKKYNYRNNL